MSENMQPKIHILYKFVEGPWGGGNQFLKALRGYFRKMGVCSESSEDADVILFNSHHCLDEVLKVKRKCPSKIFIHRVDGPVSYIGGRDRALDEIIFNFNTLIADGTIFISGACRKNNYEIGIRKCPYETTIMNAPDPTIFGPEGKRPLDGDKIKLVATSWSGNVMKGFDIYQFLDEHLDFNRYEMTFVGNSPVEFKNIKWIKPVPSGELANILREHDIYITASRFEALSQALIEALHCGLPVVARNIAAFQEAIGKSGEFFEDERGVIKAIEKIAQGYSHYQARINVPALNEVGQKYYEFAQTIYESYLNGSYNPKPISLLKIMKSNRLSMEIIRWKALNIFQDLTKRGIVADFYSKSLHRRLLEQEIIKINLSGLTLDIGSKNRRYDDYFPNTKIVAIDIEPQLKDGSIIQCDTRNMCFKDNSFDNIISFETFEYIYQIEEAVKEVKRVLKPGGIGYFSVPFLNPVHGGIGDIVRYTKRGWEELLQRYFDKVEIKSFGGRYALIFDFWFDRIRKSKILMKLARLPVALLSRNICLILDKKEKSERFVMGYFMKVEK
ncbi:methyltransferase domain-containing protein [Chloroflexota bacterium]